MVAKYEAVVMTFLQIHQREQRFKYQAIYTSTTEKRPVPADADFRLDPRSAKGLCPGKTELCCIYHHQLFTCLGCTPKITQGMVTVRNKCDPPSAYLSS